jgi:hypothetical protein
VLFSAKVGKMAACFDGSLRQAKIQEIGNGGKSGVVSLHHPRRGLFIGRIEGDGLDLFITMKVVDAGRDLTRAFDIGIRQGDGDNVGLMGHVIGCGGPHHAGADHEKFHSREFLTNEMKTSQASFHSSNLGRGRM